MLTSSDLVVAPKKLSEFAANPERSQIDPGETDPIAERCYFSLCFVVVVVVEIEQHAPSAVGPPAKSSALRGSLAHFERILGPVAARTSRDGRLTVPHSKITPRRSAKLRLWPASLGTAGRPACASKRWPARRLAPGKSQEIQEGPPCHTARWARSACVASAFSSAKNALDWPVKSPLAVRKRTAPIAAPCVSVVRTIEQTGKLRLRKTVGSGMIRLAWRSSFPANGGFERSGNTSPLVGSVTAGALPALSCQTWKCRASVGPMLSRMRNTSTLETRW